MAARVILGPIGKEAEVGKRWKKCYTWVVLFRSRWSKDHDVNISLFEFSKIPIDFQMFSHVFLPNTAGEQDMWCKKWWETSRWKPHTLQAVGSLPAGHFVPIKIAEIYRCSSPQISVSKVLTCFNPSWCRWNVPFLQMTWVNLSVLTWEKKKQRPLEMRPLGLWVTMFSHSGQWSKRLCENLWSAWLGGDFGDLHWVVEPFQTQIARLGVCHMALFENWYTLQKASKERGQWFFSSGCCFCSSEVSEKPRWACLKMGYRGIPPIFPPMMAKERDLIQIKPIILIIYGQYSLGFRGKNCRNQRFWNSFASVVGTDAEKLKMEAVLRPAGKRRSCFCFRRYICNIYISIYI